MKDSEMLEVSHKQGNVVFLSKINQNNDDVIYEDDNDFIDDDLLDDPFIDHISQVLHDNMELANEGLMNQFVEDYANAISSKTIFNIPYEPQQKSAVIIRMSCAIKDKNNNTIIINPVECTEVDFAPMVLEIS